MSIVSFYHRLFSRRRPCATFESTRAAAQVGDAEAQFALGLKYSVENRASGDLEQAAHWYEKAADQNHALAQFNLSIMHARGQGIPRNDALSLKWTRRAAEGGDAGAQHALGTRYTRKGMDSLEVDPAESRIEAYKWFHLAAAQGYQGSATACEHATHGMSRDEVTESNRRAAVFVVNRPAPPSEPASSTLAE